MALTTASDLATWNPAWSRDSTATRTTYITAAQAAMERYTGRVFENAAQVEDFRGDDTQTYWLKAVPVTGFTSVVIVHQDGTTTTVPSTTYRYDAGTGRLERYPTRRGSYTGSAYHRWPDATTRNRGGSVWGLGTIYRVSYTGGYSVGTHDAELAELQLVIHKYMDLLLADRGRAGMQQETLGAYAYTRLSQMDRDSEIARLLQPYRRVVR